jgi:3-phenylpropionate/trans-cinnamate dioxygenase ferredoxin subunit
VTVVGRVADFPIGTHRVVEVDGRSIGVFNIGGRFYGLLNRCAHQGGPLCAARRTTGTLVAGADWRPEWKYEGEIVACPWHGLEYHVPTGRCLAFPHIRVRTYEVTVVGDDVVVTPASSHRPRGASDP